MDRAKRLINKINEVILLRPERARDNYEKIKYVFSNALLMIRDTLPDKNYDYKWFPFDNVSMSVDKNGVTLSQTVEGVPKKLIPVAKELLKKEIDKLDPDLKNRVLDQKVYFDDFLKQLKFELTYDDENITEEFSQDQSQYNKLSDVYQKYPQLKMFKDGGSTQIWYTKKEVGRDFRMGFFGLLKKGLSSIPTLDNLKNTHVLIGNINRTEDKGSIFNNMQGEIWSPNGEAKTLIKNSGTDHTSMSIGDIMVFSPDRAYMVTDSGFARIYKDEDDLYSEISSFLEN